MAANHTKAVKAVIFDIGGVVVKSPLIAISAFEVEKGLPKDYINTLITRRGPTGAWQRFERGEMRLFEFYDAFGTDLSDTVNGNEWYREYCDRKKIREYSSSLLMGLLLFHSSVSFHVSCCIMCSNLG